MIKTNFLMAKFVYNNIYNASISYISPESNYSYNFYKKNANL